MKKPKRKACIDKNTRAIHILRLIITKALRKALDQPLTRPQAGGHGRAKMRESNMVDYKMFDSEHRAWLSEGEGSVARARAW